jgi:hypothetical protein
MTPDDTARPRKLLTGAAPGGQWGIAYKDAKRDDDDLCHGSKLVDGWEAITAQIVAVPIMLAVLRAVANGNGDAATLRALAKRALKAAGTKP